MKLKLVLASASPRRKELIAYLGLPFDICPADIDEEMEASSPSALVSLLALEKSKATLKKYQEGNRSENVFIIAADTLVALGSTIYSKPKDIADARRMLQELSGKTHSVFTGVAFLHRALGRETSHQFVSESRVTFDVIEDSILDLYLSTGDSLDKAGSYGIQGPSLTFISKVEGSYSNVVGLPLSAVIKEMSLFLQKSYPKTSWRELF